MVIIICLAAFFTALLTFFSGFGLGTILLPVFALFFPIDVAIALTAIVHLFNNLFKLVVVGKNTHVKVFIRFGLPALLTSFLGAWLLIKIAVLPTLVSYQLFGKEFEITPVKLIIATLLIMFSLAEILPSFQKVQWGRNKLVIGGLLSGFFGGLSGLQGALRSAFLIKSGLTKESYIATGVAIACLVDISRLVVYSSRFSSLNWRENFVLLTAAILSAITGVLVGRQLLVKVTYRTIQTMVAVMLILVSMGLGAGLI